MSNENKKAKQIVFEIAIYLGGKEYKVCLTTRWTWVVSGALILIRGISNFWRDGTG